MKNKQAYIDFIINELNSSNIKYNDVCSLFCSKFQLTERSFNKYWLKANEAYKQQREAINKELLSTTIETEKEVVKTQIKSKSQLLEKLNEIIEQKAKRVEGQIIMPSFSDVKGAIDLYCKIEGYYAPISTNNKIQIERPIFNGIDLNVEENDSTE
jgi:hypothetical protein